ncbi:MAG TPA: hypothetical protein VHM93_14755 [Candidatus Acidoferrum sp.]|nr:hypothetical protein [Candidatus Acidoferrum sp.]
MDTPMLMDVRDQIHVADSVFHWREQYHRRLAARFRAFEEHHKEIQMIGEFHYVHVRPDLGL